MIVGGLALGLTAYPRPASAAGCTGAFTIRNPTSGWRWYQVKWGRGKWRTYSLPPGSARHHSHPLGGDGRAPAPSIRFDYIVGDNAVTNRTYELDFYAV